MKEDRITEYANNDEYAPLLFVGTVQMTQDDATRITPQKNPIKKPHFDDYLPVLAENSNMFYCSIVILK